MSRGSGDFRRCEEAPVCIAAGFSPTRDWEFVLDNRCVSYKGRGWPIDWNARTLGGVKKHQNAL